MIGPAGTADLPDMNRTIRAILIAATLATAGGCAAGRAGSTAAGPAGPPEHWTEAGDAWEAVVRRTFEFDELGVLSVWWRDDELLVVVDKGLRDGFEKGLWVYISDAFGLRGSFELMEVDETTSIGRVTYPALAGPWPS